MSTEHAEEDVTEADTCQLCSRIMLQLTDEDDVNRHNDVIDECCDHGRHGDLDEIFRHFAFAENCGILLLIL